MFQILTLLSSKNLSAFAMLFNRKIRWDEDLYSCSCNTKQDGTTVKPRQALVPSSAIGGACLLSLPFPHESQEKDGAHSRACMDHIQTHAWGPGTHNRSLRGPQGSPYLWFLGPNSLELVREGNPGVKQGADLSNFPLSPSSWLLIHLPPPETVGDMLSSLR